MGVIGEFVGRELGGLAGNYFGGEKYREHGRTIGGAIGTLSPYKYGGLVHGKGKKGSPVVALIHKAEYIIPTKFVKDIPRSLKSKILKNKKKHRK